jgi:hypothetical protein
MTQSLPYNIQIERRVQWCVNIYYSDQLRRVSCVSTTYHEHVSDCIKCVSECVVQVSVSDTCQTQVQRDLWSVRAT